MKEKQWKSKWKARNKLTYGQWRKITKDYHLITIIFLLVIVLAVGAILMLLYQNNQLIEKNDLLEELNDLWCELSNEQYDMIQRLGYLTESYRLSLELETDIELPSLVRILDNIERIEC